MSYILEALKKAQAERQLGSAPTIHAPSIHAGLPDSPAPHRTLFWIGAVLAVLAVAMLAGWMWRQKGENTFVTAPALAPVMAPVIAPVTAPVIAPSPAPAMAINPVAPAVPVSAAAASAFSAAPPENKTAGQNVRAARAQVTGAANPDAREATLNDPSRGQSVAPPTLKKPPEPPPKLATVSEDAVPMLRELPDALRRELPVLKFGGYIYSGNPSDRLLLVDKALRHEGEELAPGLILEKLLPKSALLNYKGTRFTMPY
jgi:general secretion pathway protein B